MMGRKASVVGLIFLAVLITAEMGHCQSQSQYALLRKPVFKNPLIWKMTRSMTNTNWGVNLYARPLASAQSYIMDTSYYLHSAVSFDLDHAWNRIIYYECLDSWIRAYSTYGTGTCQLSWPRSLDVLAPFNDEWFSWYYYIYIADTENDRIVRLQYDWRPGYQYMICDGNITGGGLERPIDLDLHNGGTFWPETDDYLWVLNGSWQLKRFTPDGVLHNTVAQAGCDSAVGSFCRPTAVVCGRNAFLVDPDDRYANDNNIYVADASNNRIAWLVKQPGGETVSWQKSVNSTSSIVDLEVDGFGQVWAVDRDNGMITKYTFDLYPLCTFGSTGIGENQFIGPTSLSSHCGYYGIGTMYVVEDWTDSSGGQYFGIGTDILDFDVTSSANERFHHTSFVLVDPSKVTIWIYGFMHGWVTTLVDAALMSGSCNFTWDGTDSLGQPCDSGLYWVLVVDTCFYGDIYTGEPANVVIKDQWFDHVYNPYIDYTPGDVNDDGSVDVADMSYLVAYLFEGGPLPQPYECVGDIDATGSIDVGDLTYLVAYLFQGGSALLDGCQVWQE